MTSQNDDGDSADCLSLTRPEGGEHFTIITHQNHDSGSTELQAIETKEDEVESPTEEDDSQDLSGLIVLWLLVALLALLMAWNADIEKLEASAVVVEPEAWYLDDQEPKASAAVVEEPDEQDGNWVAWRSQSGRASCVLLDRGIWLR